MSSATASSGTPCPVYFIGDFKKFLKELDLREETRSEVAHLQAGPTIVLYPIRGDYVDMRIQAVVDRVGDAFCGCAFRVKDISPGTTILSSFEDWVAFREQKELLNTANAVIVI